MPGASTSAQNLVNVAVTLFMMLPFLYGIGVSTGSAKSSTIKLIKEKRGNILPVFGLMFARIFIAIGFILAAVSSHVNLAGWMVAAIFLAGVLLFIVARYYFRRFDAMVERFMINLNEKEEAARRRSPVRTTVQDSMAGYDVHIEELVLSPDSMYVGQRLMDLPLRSESGANIIKVTRGSRKIVIPGGDERVYPFDRLLAVGTSEQLSRLRELLASSVSLSENDSSDPNFKVVPILLGPDSWLTGKQLRSVRLRDMGCMIISILRGDHFITNPKADLVFQTGDRVWIAGDTDSIDWLR
jgi:CPA2 family monovalent cation:H+ antiporter-2